MKFILSLFTTILFSQSALAISASKCQSNDWFSVGRDYGVKGQPSDKVMSLQKSCMKKGVDIPLDQYKKGWEIGIAQFCSPDNAYTLGFKKKKASKACPVEIKANFDQFYNWGKNASQSEKTIKNNESKLKSKEKALKSLNNKTRKLENEISKLKEKNKKFKDEVNSIEQEMKSKRSLIKSSAE